MTDANDKIPSTKPAKTQPVVDLPFATPKEHAEFFSIIRQLEAGTLSDDKARERMLMLYDTGLGAWVRALGRSHPEIAARVAKGLLRDLEQVAQNFDDDAETSNAGPKPARPRTPRLTAKSVEVLERERLILEALTRANEALTLAELRKIVEQQEPSIEAPALTANLDRLERDGAIARPRKGYYHASEKTRTFMAAIDAELEARGSRKR